MTDVNLVWKNGEPELVPVGMKAEIITEEKSLVPVPSIPHDDFIKDAPLKNEPFGIISHPYGVYQPISYNTLWAYFKDSPEVIACVTAIIEDILSDGYSLDGEKLDVKRAEEFITGTSFMDLLESILFDAFVTGDGYIYVGQNSLSDVRKRILSMIPSEFKSYNSYFSESIISELKDEEFFTPFGITYLPSSTVRLDYNVNAYISQYVQIVGTQYRWFRPEEVVHFKLMDLDGKAYGYSPFQAVLKEIDILTNIKDYAKYFFEKGGVPNFAWIFEDEDPNSPNILAVKKALQMYANLSNKWKSLIITGKTRMEKLQNLNKDMEFRDLARYITQVIVNVFGVPATRLPGLLMDSKIKGALSSDGYYRKVSHWQNKICRMLNARIFRHFRVKFRLNKTYKQDEIREVQATKVKADVSMQLYNSGVVTKDWVWEYLDIPQDRRGDIKKPGEMLNPTQNQNQLNNTQIMSDSPDKLADNQRKQESAIDNKN